jgi:23S rRNA pseudouridine1911/1915/1917 synthase
MGEVTGSTPVSPTMNIKIIYEDKDLLVVDKPAGMPVFKEGNISENTLADYLIEKYPELKKNEPPRYGIAHRLDKDTSGLLLVAKSPEALIFFQKQFKNRTIQKKYLALVVGTIKDQKGTIDTLIGRSPKDPKKQKAFFAGEPGSFGKRQAVTEYKVAQDFESYTLLEVIPKTGRKHQIRCHLAYIHHPIAGDKVYGFRRQPAPKGLSRHFLHASYLKIKLPSGQEKEFESLLPEDLNKIIKNLEITQ